MSEPSEAELLILQQIAKLRSTDPVNAARHMEVFKRYLCSKPITEALGDVQLSFAAELDAQAKQWGSSVWLECLLNEAVSTALEQGNPDLARVITAIRVVAAAGAGDYAPLLKECEGKTMLGIANRYLDNLSEKEGGGAVLAGIKRPVLLKEISKLFSPEPQPNPAAVARIVERLPAILDFGSATVLFGISPPTGWPARVQQEVLDLRERGQDGEREPGHYVRAVLVGLGIDKETAKGWVKGMRK